MATNRQGPDATDVMAQQVATAARVLSAAQRVLVLTGAGMSVDSGLPTYRGIGGLYDDADVAEGMPIEQALSGDVFASRPALTWKYIGQIERTCRGAQPNRGHAVLARLQARYQRLCILTQNIDGFHATAGSRDVIEMHGNIHQLLCTGCERRTEVAEFSHFGALPPLCPVCGSVLRPQVVLFGEMLPLRAVARYEMALADELDAIVAIGTSAVFPYIAEPVRDAWQRGIATIEINPQQTNISPFCRTTLRLPAAQALTAIEQHMAA